MAISITAGLVVLAVGRFGTVGPPEAFFLGWLGTVLIVGPIVCKLLRII